MKCLQSHYQLNTYYYMYKMTSVKSHGNHKAKTYSNYKKRGLKHTITVLIKIISFQRKGTKEK